MKRRPSLGNGKYRLWDATTGRQLAILGEGRFTAYNSAVPAFRPDGKRVATAEGEFIRISDADTGRQLSLAGPLGSPVDRVFFSPDGKIIADQVFLCDGDTGLRLAVLGDPKSADWFFAWSPRLAARDVAGEYPENSVRLWDASTGKLIRTMPGHTNAVMSLAFSL